MPRQHNPHPRGAHEMDYKYIFPNLLPGEGGERARLERPDAVTRAKCIVTRGGKVLIAEWILVNEKDEKDHILVPGWILTEPYRINSGQLRISVQPLTESEQLEYRELIRNRFRSDQYLSSDHHHRKIPKDCSVIFWNLEA